MAKKLSDFKPTPKKNKDDHWVAGHSLPNGVYIGYAGIAKNRPLAEEYDPKVLEKKKKNTENGDQTWDDYVSDHTDNDHIAHDYDEFDSKMHKMYPLEEKPHYHQLKKYTSSSHELNSHLYDSHLKGKAPKHKVSGKEVKKIDEAIASQPLKHKLSVYSGAKFNPYEALQQSKDGLVYLPAYTSSSWSKDVARGFAVSGDHPRGYGKHVLHVHLNPGDKGAWMGSKSSFDSEKEFIMPRGLAVKIDPEPEVKDNGYGDKTYIWHTHVAKTDKPEYQPVEPEVPYDQDQYNHYVKLQKHIEHHKKLLNQTYDFPEVRNWHEDKISKYKKLIDADPFRNNADYDDRNDAKEEARSKPLKPGEYDHSLLGEHDEAPKPAHHTPEFLKNLEDYQKLLAHQKYYNDKYSMASSDSKEEADYLDKSQKLKKILKSHPLVSQAKPNEFNYIKDGVVSVQPEDEDEKYVKNAIDNFKPDPELEKRRQEYVNLLRHQKYHYNKYEDYNLPEDERNEHFAKYSYLGKLASNTPFYNNADYEDQDDAQAEANTKKVTDRNYDPAIAAKLVSQYDKNSPEHKDLVKAWQHYNYYKDLGKSKGKNKWSDIIQNHPATDAWNNDILGSSGNMPHPASVEAKNNPISQAEGEVPYAPKDKRAHADLVKLYQHKNLYKKKHYDTYDKIHKKYMNAIDAKIKEHPEYKHWASVDGDGNHPAEIEAKQSEIQDADNKWLADKHGVEPEKPLDMNSPENQHLVNLAKKKDYHDKQYNTGWNKDYHYKEHGKAHDEFSKHPAYKTWYNDDGGIYSESPWTKEAKKAPIKSLKDLPDQYGAKDEPEAVDLDHPDHKSAVDLFKKYKYMSDNYMDGSDTALQDFKNHPKVKEYMYNQGGYAGQTPWAKHAKLNPIKSLDELDPSYKPKPKYGENSPEYKELVKHYQHSHYHNTKGYEASDSATKKKHYDMSDMHETEATKNPAYKEFFSQPGSGSKMHPANKDASANEIKNVDPLWEKEKLGKTLERGYFDPKHKDHKELIGHFQNMLAAEKKHGVGSEESTQHYNKIIDNPHYKKWKAEHPKTHSIDSPWGLHAQDNPLDDDYDYKSPEHKELVKHFQNLNYHTKKWTALSGDEQKKYFKDHISPMVPTFANHPSIKAWADKYPLSPGKPGKPHPAAEEADANPIDKPHGENGHDDLVKLYQHMNYHTKKAANLGSTEPAFQHHVDKMDEYEKKVKEHPEWKAHWDNQPKDKFQSLYDHPAFEKADNNKLDSIPDEDYKKPEKKEDEWAAPDFKTNNSDGYDELVKHYKHYVYHLDKSDHFYKTGDKEARKHHKDLHKEYRAKIEAHPHFTADKYDFYSHPAYDEAEKDKPNSIPDEDYKEPVKDHKHLVSLYQQYHHHSAQAFDHEETDKDKHAHHTNKAMELDDEIVKHPEYKKFYADKANKKKLHPAENEALDNPTWTKKEKPKDPNAYDTDSDEHKELVKLHQSQNHAIKHAWSQKDEKTKQDYYDHADNLYKKIEDHPLTKKFYATNGNLGKQHPASAEADKNPVDKFHPEHEPPKPEPKPEPKKEAPEYNPEEHDELKHHFQQYEHHLDKAVSAQSGSDEYISHINKASAHMKKIQNHPAHDAHIVAHGTKVPHPAQVEAKKHPATEEKAEYDPNNLKKHIETIKYHHGKMNDAYKEMNDAKLAHHSKQMVEASKKAEAHPDIIAWKSQGKSMSSHPTYKEVYDNK